MTSCMRATPLVFLFFIDNGSEPAEFHKKNIHYPA
jgi:hypothetical protein